MATPATRAGSELTRSPGALGRILVGAQAEERRLAELVARGPLRIRDLGDELRPHPGGTADAGRRRERTARRAQPREPRAERHERLPRGAGADLADEPEGATPIEADGERAELLAAPGPRCVPPEHTPTPLAAPHLSPR